MSKCELGRGREEYRIKGRDTWGWGGGVVVSLFPAMSVSKSRKRISLLFLNLKNAVDV